MNLVPKTVAYRIANSIAMSDRKWCEAPKNPKLPGLRKVCFRFDRADDADRVAEGLRMMAAAMGYTVDVRRTSVPWNGAMRTRGGEYVRLEALAD